MFILRGFADNIWHRAAARQIHLAGIGCGADHPPRRKLLE